MSGTYTEKRNGRVKMEIVLALAAVIGQEVEKQVTWLQSMGLLGRNKTCPACNQQVNELI